MLRDEVIAPILRPGGVDDPHDPGVLQISEDQRLVEEHPAFLLAGAVAVAEALTATRCLKTSCLAR
jgi:hypothetical protein